MLGRTSGLYPFVHFVLLEFPKTAHAVRGHLMLIDPAVNSVTAAPKVLAYLIY